MKPSQNGIEHKSLAKFCAGRGICTDVTSGADKFTLRTRICLGGTNFGRTLLAKSILSLGQDPLPQECSPEVCRCTLSLVWTCWNKWWYYGIFLEFISMTHISIVRFALPDLESLCATVRRFTTIYNVQYTVARCCGKPSRTVRGMDCMKMWPWMRDLPNSVRAGRGWALDENGLRRLTFIGGSSAMQGVEVLVKQSGVPGVKWNSTCFAWEVPIPKYNSKGKRKGITQTKSFQSANLWSMGLEAAKAFRAEVRKGVFKEPKERDPNFTSDVPGVRWRKHEKKWYVEISLKKSNPKERSNLIQGDD